jgi:hypothetical protein
VSSELDRVVLALLNATGVVYRAIEDTDHSGPGLMPAVTERVRAALARFAEHYTDAELGELAAVLGQITLLLAEDLGLEEYFRSPSRAARTHRPR